MKEISVSELRSKGLAILDTLGADGVIITKRGKPVARLWPVNPTSVRLIGSLKGRVVVDPDDELQSTGIRWNAQDGIL